MEIGCIGQEGVGDQVENLALVATTTYDAFPANVHLTNAVRLFGSRLQSVSINRWAGKP